MNYEQFNLSKAFSEIKSWRQTFTWFPNQFFYEISTSLPITGSNKEKKMGQIVYQSQNGSKNLKL